VTYAAKIDKAEARITWDRPAVEVARHINGLSPFPGAWFEANGERIKALRAEVAPGKPQIAAGTVLDDALTIACADGSAVRLLRLQRPGKGALDAEALLRGWQLPAGLTL
jgi:methionyl-tRNA formyltransferase